jgi:outer membrane biosynthesis protein TonB
MATAPPKPDPFDDVRDAFKSLGTSEKAAFVLEATFDTIGQALAETGRRAATVLDDLDIDDWFRAREPEDVGAPPPPPPAPPPPKTPPPPAAPPPPVAKAPKPKKTAGKPKPPTADDSDDAA